MEADLPSRLGLSRPHLHGVRVQKPLGGLIDDHQVALSSQVRLQVLDRFAVRGEPEGQHR